MLWPGGRGGAAWGGIGRNGAGHRCAGCAACRGSPGTARRCGRETGARAPGVFRRPTGPGGRFFSRAWGSGVRRWVPRPPLPGSDGLPAVGMELSEPGGSAAEVAGRPLGIGGNILWGKKFGMLAHEMGEIGKLPRRAVRVQQVPHFGRVVGFAFGGERGGGPPLQHGGRDGGFRLVLASGGYPAGGGAVAVRFPPIHGAAAAADFLHPAVGPGAGAGCASGHDYSLR